MLNITNKKSTLSLHIAAYENSNEAFESDLFHDENIEGLKKENLGLIKTSKHFFTDRLMNLFEFPRQQNENQRNESEIMQLKASQRLLDSQSPATAQQIGNNGGQMPSGADTAAVNTPSNNDAEFFDTPTTLSIYKDRFSILESGTNSVVRFLFDLKINVHTLPTSPLIPGFLSWNGHELFHYTAAASEDVIGIELHNNSEDITIWTSSSAYNGLCSSINHIQDISVKPIFTIMSPNPADVNDFFKGIRKASPVPSPSSTSCNQPSSSLQCTPSPSAKTVVAKTSKKGKKRGTKRKADGTQKKKDKVKVTEKSSDELQFDRMKNLSNKLEVECNTLQHPKPEKIDVNQLKHDETIRCLRKDFVNRLVNQMEQNLWKHDAVVLSVNKVGEQYFVIDGNHRLEALLIFLVNNPKSPYKKVFCRVYNNLTLDQILLVCQPTFTPHIQLKLTELQMLKLSLDYKDYHLISITSKKSVFYTNFNKLMKKVVGEEYPKFVTKLVMLHPRVHEALLQQQYQGTLMSAYSFPSRFWMAFIKAVRNNTTAALNVLKSLKDNTVSDVLKKLKGVELDLIGYLNQYGSPEWETNSAAAIFFAGNDKTSPESVKRLLCNSKAIHNSKRSTKNALISWNDVKKKLDNWLARKYKNIVYSGISVDNFDEIDFILLIDPVESLLERLQEATKTAVIVIVSSDDSVIPVIPNVEPTSNLKVVTSKPVVIDSTTNTLPKVYSDASLYIPNVPTEAKEEYLTSIAVEKNCKFASILEFNDLHIFGKYADEYNHAVVYFNSMDSQDIVAELRYYEKLSIFGNKKIQSFAEKLLASSKDGEMKEDGKMGEDGEMEEDVQLENPEDDEDDDQQNSDDDESAENE